MHNGASVSNAAANLLTHRAEGQIGRRGAYTPRFQFGGFEDAFDCQCSNSRQAFTELSICIVFVCGVQLVHSLSLSQPVELEILEVLTSVAKEFGVSRWLATAEDNVR